MLVRKIDLENLAVKTIVPAIQSGTHPQSLLGEEQFEDFKKTNLDRA
jgi:hypothetical protein